MRNFAENTMKKTIENMTKLEKPDAILECPKCGGFRQYFKNTEMCRDCGYIIQTFPVKISNTLPEFIIVHEVDGKKKVIPVNKEQDVHDMLKEIIIAHQDRKVVSSIDAIETWDACVYKKVF